MCNPGRRRLRARRRTRQPARLPRRRPPPPPSLPPLPQLFLISGTASLVAIQAAGPLLRAFKRTRVAARVKALLAAESDLNAEIADAAETFKAGSNVVAYAKLVNDAERALRAAEADAATRRMRAAQRDAMVAQLDFLVSLQASSSAGSDAAVVKAARAGVEAALEKDSKAQQATIEVRAARRGEAAGGGALSRASGRAAANRGCWPRLF